MRTPKFGISAGGYNANSLKGINTSHANAQDLIAASYFSRGVVGDDIYRDLTDNNIRCIPVGQLQSYHDATNTSGDTTGHQGYTTDGTWHYTIDTGALYKNTDDATWKAGGAGPDKVDTNATPFSDLESTTDHLGDGQYYDSQLIIAATNGNSSAPFLSQIALYNVSAGLDYAHHVQITTSGTVAGTNSFGCSGLSYNPATDELFVVDYYGNYSSVFVYDLSELKAETAGAVVAPKRTITLNFPSYQTQGIYFRNGELWLSQNDGDIFVYDLSGRLNRSYFIDGAELPISGGNQGIDYSASQLRLVKSNLTVGQGVVNYFDIDSIPVKTGTHDGTGERLEHAHSMRQVFDSIYMDKAYPDTGTQVLRIKIRSAGPRLLKDTRINSIDWQLQTLDSVFPVQIRGWLNTVVVLHPNDNLAQNTYIDVAFTWDRYGGVSSGAQATIIVDGTQTVGADDTWGTTPLDVGIGVIHRGKGAVGDTTLPDYDVLYWYTYNTVKTLTEINAIHADPAGMIG